MPDKHYQVRLESEKRLDKLSKAVDNEAIRSATELEVAYQLAIADEEKRKLEDEIKRITEIEQAQRKEAASKAWKGAALLFRNAKAGEAVLKAGEASAAAALALEETRRVNASLATQMSITERLKSEIIALELDARVTREALTTTKSALDDESAALEAAANEVLRLRDESAKLSLALRASSGEAINLGKLLVTSNAENHRLNAELEWERKQRHLLDQKLGKRPRTLLHVLDIIAITGYFLEIEKCATLCKATWRLGGGIEAISARSKYARLKHLYFTPKLDDNENDNDDDETDDDSVSVTESMIIGSQNTTIDSIQVQQKVYGSDTTSSSVYATTKAPVETIQAIEKLTKHVENMEISAVFHAGILETDTLSNTLRTTHLPDSQPDTFSPVLLDRSIHIMASSTKEVLSSKQPSEAVCIDLKPVLDVVESLSTPLPSVSFVENSSPVGTHVTNNEEIQVDTQIDIDISVAAKQSASRRRREHRDAYFAKRYEPEWMHSARLQAQPYRMPNFWSLAAHRTYGLWGRTRLMAAAHFGHIDRVELLLREHGAHVHPSQTATNNRTALVEAEANGHSSTASLLRAYGAHPFSITLGEPHIASPVKTVISGKVLAIAVLPNGHIITGGEDGIINVWNAGDVSNSHWTCLQQMRGKHDLICALAVVSDRTHSISVKTLRVASGGSSSVILNSASVVENNNNNTTDGSKDIKEIKETKESTTCLESSESAICIWKLSTSACEIVLRGHKTRCTALASLRDGEWLASGGDNRTIRIWNIIETSASFGTCVLKLRGHLGSINSITILPDNRLASSSSDGTIRLWTLPNDSISIIAYCSTILTVPSEENDPSSSSSSVLSSKSTPLAISSIVAGLQKNRIAAARADGSVCVWDIQSGLLLDQQFGHRGAISVPLSSLPDGRLVSGGDDDDKTLRIWKIDINGSLIPLPEWKTKCPCGVSVISAASDGRVFTGFTDGTITAWK